MSGLRLWAKPAREWSGSSRTFDGLGLDSSIGKEKLRRSIRLLKSIRPVEIGLGKWMAIYLDGTVAANRGPKLTK